MKIVHIITRLIIGGAQENTLLTCEGLAVRGHEVTLLAGPTTGPEGSLVERAKAYPEIHYEVIPGLVRSAAQPWNDLAAWRQLRKRLAELQPDIVHTHSAKAGILGRYAAAAVCPRAAVIHTIHGLAFHPYQNPFIHRFYAAIERRAARKTDHFITVANAMTEQAVAAGLGPPEKFTTIYSGLEVASFLHPSEPVARVREKYALPASAVVIVKVARLFHLKGHDDVLRAFALLSERHPTLYLFFVGDGVLRSHLEHLADKLGVRHKLRFAGLVPPGEVPALIHASDILVHASLREGLARVLPQARLSGRPVVSYDVDGAREVVHTGETGVLVAPRDWRGLARALNTLVGDRRLRERMGERGRAICTAMFDHNKMVDEIAKVYERVLQTKPR